MRIKALLTIGLLVLSLTAFSQPTQPTAPAQPSPAPAPAVVKDNTVPTQPSPPASQQAIIAQTFDWLTSFNTNLTTWNNRFELWTSVISESGGVAPLVNEVGISYDIVRLAANVTNGTVAAVFLEANERNTGLSGTISSFQGGVGVAYMIWDLRLSTAIDIGDNLQRALDQNRVYGEWNFKIQKALGPHWATGIGFFVDFPSQNRTVQGLIGQLTASF